ncbi:MAG: hypothetical protein R2761_19295 [Acidimicrobiales bacterium]
MAAGQGSGAAAARAVEKPEKALRAEDKVSLFVEAHMNAMAMRTPVEKPKPQPDDATAPDATAQEQPWVALADNVAWAEASGVDEATVSPNDSDEVSAPATDGWAEGTGEPAGPKSTSGENDPTDDEHQIELAPAAEPVEENPAVTADGSAGAEVEQDLDVAHMLELLRRHRATRPDHGIDR